MRSKRRLRACLASLMVGGLLGALLVACGDDDTGTAGIIPAKDAGAMDTSRSDAGG